MFNFYLFLAGRDMVTDGGSATTCRSKLKAPSSQTKSKKNEGPSDNMSFTEKSFEDFRQKKNTSSLDQTTPWKTLPLNAKI